jgi:adenine/guanine phosphoribosyltransferase-like PRPP-binding protein
MQQLYPVLVVKKQRVAGIQHVFGSTLSMNTEKIRLVMCFESRGIVLAIW